MEGGFFSGAFRWLMGRFGSSPSQVGGGVCATVAVAPRVTATAAVAGRVSATVSIVPSVNATVTVEAC